MTKEILEQYLDVKEEIKQLEKRIEKVKKQSAMVADTVQNGLQGKKKRISVIYGYNIERAELLKKYYQKLEAFKNKLLEQEIEVEEFIQEIKNSKTRQIFQYRYYDGLDWYQIAQLMNYAGESAPRMNHDRFLEKI